MSQFGKASSKRGKPTYAYAIIGVSLVLFLFGIVGWFFLNLRKTGDYFKENIQVQCFLNRDATPKKIDSVKNYISALSYVKSAEHVTKEMAIQKFEADNDTTWRQFIKSNPLPESIDFYVTADHVQSDSLRAISSTIESNFPGIISEYKFPDEIVSKVGDFAKYLFIGFLVAGFPGACVAATCTFLPCYFFTVIPAPYSKKYAKNVSIKAFVDGITAAVVGALVGSVIVIATRSII